MLIRFKNLNLRFLGEGGGEAGGGAAPEIDASATISTEAPAPEGSEGNPAWETLRSKLDPISFRAIQDDLKAMDAAANQRVTSVNEQMKPWKQFTDAGFTPEKIQQAVSIAQRLDAEPEQIYEALGTFLERNGRLPSKQELTTEVKDQQEAAPEGQQENPEFSALQAQTEQIMQFLSQQAKAELDRAADVALDNEVAALQTAHPELSREDIQELYTRAAIAAQRTGKVPSLEEAYSDYNALRTRILTAPRPGDSAPKLLPTSGGVPSSSQQKSLGQLSATETQSLIADLVEKNRSGS